MFKIALVLAAFVGSTANFDPDPPGGPEPCAFLPACDPCHWPNKPPLPGGWGWGPHGEIIRCP